MKTSEFFQTDWFKSRPPEIQELLRRYPPGTELQHEGQVWHVVGATETTAKPVLMVSLFDPRLDYEMAQTNAEHFCPDCLEGLECDRPEH